MSKFPDDPPPEVFGLYEAPHGKWEFVLYTPGKPYTWKAGVPVATVQPSFNWNMDGTQIEVMMKSEAEAALFNRVRLAQSTRAALDVARHSSVLMSHARGATDLTQAYVVARSVFEDKKR